MKQVDYIVVGCSLAGIAICEELIKRKKSFIVFDNNSQNSSIVAAGLYNPVILKRFSEVWMAKEQLQILRPFYTSIEKRLDIKIDYPLDILRRFSSIEEQNLWFNAMDKHALEPFLSPVILQNTNAYIDAPFGFGKVLNAGRIDTNTLIKAYKNFLRSNNSLFEEAFVHHSITTANEGFIYNGITAKHIIFCEGFGLKSNPFFNNLPLNGTKGEVLKIRSQDLNITYGIKSSVFVIPDGNNEFTVGATYNWNDKTNLTTEEGKNELLSKLKTFLKCDFEVIDHLAGIRPTVKDRRPLVGEHPEFKNMFVFNGLGTRGVMIAPYAANQLLNYIEQNDTLNSEIDIKRFL